MTTDRVVQESAALLAITNPLGAAGFFLAITDGQTARERYWGAAYTTIAVALILGGSALVGRPVLDLFGIDLPAFKIAGGLVIVIMGLEMTRGSPSKVQGGAHHVNTVRDNLVVPLAMPIIAGPGAITTAITLTTRDPGTAGVAITMTSIAVASIVLLITLFLATAMERLITPRMIAIATRFMGLLLIAIGFQLGLDALKTVFG